MSCIITYKGQKYSEKQFKEYFINNKHEFATSIAKNKDVMDSFKRKMEGIDFVFSQSPELASIGNKAQYLQYLSTIFKTSKVKDIVYHGTDVENIKFIKNNTEGYFSKAKGGTPNAIFFSKDRAPKGSIYDRKHILSIVLNAKNSYIRDDKGDRDSYPENYKTTINNAEKNGYDSVQILNTHDNFDTDVFVVFDPEQIHILGSKQDIEGFKKFTKRQSNDINNQENNNIEQSQINENNTESFTKESLNKKIDELLKSGEIYYTDDDSKPCAANGLRNTVKGTDWKIATEFKGKSHAQGGIDITLNENGYHFRRGGKDIKAANGLIIENK